MKIAKWTNGTVVVDMGDGSHMRLSGAQVDLLTGLPTVDYHESVARALEDRGLARRLRDGRLSPTARGRRVVDEI